MIDENINNISNFGNILDEYMSKYLGISYINSIYDHPAIDYVPSNSKIIYNITQDMQEFIDMWKTVGVKFSPADINTRYKVVLNIRNRGTFFKQYPNVKCSFYKTTNGNVYIFYNPYSSE